MTDNPTDSVVTDAMLIAGGEAATKAGMEYSRYADIEAIYLAMSQASPPPEAANEIERLREALTKIADRAATMRRGTDDWFELVGFETVAREALSKGDE